MPVPRISIPILLFLLLFSGCKENELVAPRMKIMEVEQADDYSGDITVRYTMSHKDSKVSAFLVEYSADVDTSWHPVTEGSGSDGSAGLITTSKGFWHKFVWSTSTDLPNSSRKAKLRFVPYTVRKGSIKFGRAVETSSLRIRNFTMGTLGCVGVIVGPDVVTDSVSPAITSFPDGGIAALWESRNSTNSVIKFSTAPADSVVFAAPVDLNPAQSTNANEISPDIGSKPDGSLFAVWTEPVSGFSRIMFTIGYDNGTTWKTPAQPSSRSDLDETDPRLLVQPNSVRLVRATGLPGVERKIYESYRPEGGYFSYELKINLGFSGVPFDHQAPDLVKGDSGQLVCAWVAERGGKYFVWSTLSHDDLNWEWANLVSDADSTEPTNVRICVDGKGSIHAVWTDNREGEPRIYGSESHNNGYSWTVNRRLIDVSPGVICASPDIVADTSGQVSLFWIDNSSGTLEVYAATSPDNGTTFPTPILMSPGKLFPGWPCVSVRASLTPDGVPVCAIVEQADTGKLFIRFARGAR